MPGETPSQTVGPFLSLGLPWEHGPVANPEGARIWGRVLDGAGDPIVDALVEAWHHDPPSFARSPTDDDGRWEVRVPRAPYVAVHVFARGLLRHLSTRIYLEPPDDDPVLSAVPADRRETLIAEREDDGYRFDIRIQGERETVFFDV
ncbi:MAG: protocatechuate 3,4-dioxygenase subunit alpha [Solirubrobacteraceae bacterium]